MYLCMYTNIIWLCMIKARIRWCSCRVENILTLGKLLRLWFCFLLHSILFFYISNLLSYIQNNFKLWARSPHNGNLFSSYIDDEEIAKISCFCRAAEIDFQSLAGPRSVSVDLKYDVLCLWVFLYGLTAWVGRSNGLNFVSVGGNVCANPT